MGGLVTLKVVNQRPELFRGVIFEGTPFRGVPLIVWALHRGAPLMINPSLLGPDLHFACRQVVEDTPKWLEVWSNIRIFRSSYVFLPPDGTCLVDEKGNDIVLDYFDPLQ
jgi:pimeloyl-ACP methyl ester carboxylesterase